MEYIAYNTKLDIKTLIKEKQQSIQNQKDSDKRIFEMNKKSLLPYVLTYIHYCVEVHNNIVLNSAYGYSNTRAMTGLDNAPELDLKETIERYTQDCFFESFGGVWQCNLFHFKGQKSSPKIWLNNRAGAHVNNRTLEYSMTGHDSVYAETIEQYIEEATKAFLKAERHPNE